MANRMTSIIMNNIVDKCSDYNRRENNGNDSKNIGSNLSKNETKTLSDLINVSGKGSSVNSVSSNKTNLTTTVKKGSAVKLDDIIGKNNSVKSSSSENVINKNKKVSGKVNLDDYLKNLKK